MEPSGCLANINKTVSEFKLDGEYFKFTAELRRIMNIPMVSVADMGKDKNISYDQLPFRVQLSTFENQEPITSYGCIVFHEHGNQIKLLMTKRERSIEFIDFVRGQYRLSHLYFVIRQLPQSERNIILENRADFDKLWNSHWCSSIEQTQNSASSFNHGKNWFNKIEPYLDDIFRLCPSADPHGYNLYIFPKGRLDIQRNEDNIQESKLQCAMREYVEETNGCPIQQEWICHSEPIAELFVGSNSKNYATVYFIFKSPQQFDTPESVLWVDEQDISKYLGDRIELYNIFKKLSLSDGVALSECWKDNMPKTNI